MTDNLKNPGYLNLQTHNAPLTSHHHNIINTALSDHTLVHSLSDWDATIIAADLTRQFYTKNASGQIILISTSSEWINQLNDYLTRIIPSDAVIHLTAMKVTKKRGDYWNDNRIFLASPRIVLNDINSGKCLVEHIRHFVLHDAHRAKGNHLYCQIVSLLNHMKYKDYKMLVISNTYINEFKTVIRKLKPRIISSTNNSISEIPAPSESTPQARCPITTMHQIPEAQPYPTSYGSNHAHNVIAVQNQSPQDCHHRNLTGPHCLHHPPVQKLCLRREENASKTSWNIIKQSYTIKAPGPSESTPEARCPTTAIRHIPETPQYLTICGRKHTHTADSRDLLPRRLSAGGSNSDNRTDMRHSITEDEYRQSSSSKYHDRELPTRKEYRAMSTGVDPDKEPTLIVDQTNLLPSRTQEPPVSDSWLPSMSGRQIYASPSALVANSKSPNNTVSYMEEKLSITTVEASFKNPPDKKKRSRTKWLESQKTSQNCSSITSAKDLQSFAEILQYIDNLNLTILPSNRKPNLEPVKEPSVIITLSNLSSPRTTVTPFDDSQASSTSGLQKDVSLSVPVTNSTESPSNAASYVEVLPITKDCQTSKATETSFSDNQQPITSRLEENILSSASVTNSNIETCAKAVCDIEVQVVAAPIVEDCSSHQSPPLSLKKRKRIHQQENDISPVKRNGDIRNYPQIEQICYLLDNLSNVTKKHCYICKNDNSECSILQALRKSSVVKSLKHLQIPDINLIDNLNADTILNSVNYFNKINGELKHSKICDKNIGKYGVESTLRMQASIGITEEQPTLSNTELTDGSSIDTNLNSVNQSDKEINELNNNNVNESANFDFNEELDIDDLLAELNEYHTEKTNDTEFIEEDMTSKISTEQSLSGPASTSPGGPQVEDNSPEQSNIVERRLSTLKSSDRPQMEDNFPKQSNNLERPRSPLMSSEQLQLEDNFLEPSNILERARSPLVSSDRPQLEDNYSDPSNILVRARSPLMSFEQPQLEDNLEQSNILECARSPLMTSDRPQLEDNYLEQSNILECARSPLMTSDRPQLEDIYPDQSNILKRARSPLMTSDPPQLEDNYIEQSNILECARSPLMTSDRPQLEDIYPDQSNILKRARSPLMTSDPPQLEDNYPDQSNILERPQGTSMSSDRRQLEDNYLEQHNILVSPLTSPDDRPQMEDKFPEQFNILESSLLDDNFTTPDGLQIENPLISPDQVEDNFSKPPLKRKYSLSTIRKCSSKIHTRKQPRIG